MLDLFVTWSSLILNLFYRNKILKRTLFDYIPLDHINLMYLMTLNEERI